MYKISKKVELISTEEEMVIIFDEKQIMNLNRTGKEIVEELLVCNTLDEVISNISKKYDKKNHDQIVSNVKMFFERLLSLGIVVDK